MPGDERRETSASRRAHAPERDPRDIVTEYAFRVDPDLLGVPLAGPVRRAAGMLVDLFVLGLLFPLRAAASALMGGIVDLGVALAAAWVLFRLASPASRGRTPGRAAQFVIRAAAVVIALVGAGSFVGDTFGGGDGADRSASAPADSVPAEVVEEAPGLRGAGNPLVDIRAGGADWSLRQLAGGIGDLVTLSRAEDPEDAQPVADRVAVTLARMGATRSETRKALSELISQARDERPGWVDTVVSRAMARADSAARVEGLETDSLVTRYARALAAGDTARVASLRPELRDALAGERIEALEETNDRLEERLEEAERTPGFVQRARTLITEDLGLGLGWLGLYFTVFVALWDGRTPGKTILGTRVVNLDGEPLGWWDAFSRFGGYAAGLATGMLGYLQIAWDPNRQALHDRVAGTVVIRTRGPGKRYRRTDA